MSFDTEINLSSSIDAENPTKLANSFENSVKIQSFFPESEIFQDNEPLYFAILQWVLRKTPQSADFKANSAFSVDESDKIQEIALISLLIAFFKNCGHAFRAKMLQDLIMLAKWNAENREILMESEEFLVFLLDVLIETQTVLMENAGSQAICEENSAVFIHFIQFF